MRESFPALTHLDLEWNYHWPAPFPVISPGFLGKSAAGLQHLRLSYISFPQLSTFLLSARNLVTLELKEMVVPPKVYIPPEAMVGSLAVLTRLTTLSISFHDEEIIDRWRGRPDADPSMRSVLPALTYFHCIGRIKYLEDFLTRIDAPLLDNVRIEIIDSVFHHLEDPQTQLSRFIERSENLKLDQFTRARVTFIPKGSYFKLDRPQGKRSLSLNILENAYPRTQARDMAHLLGQVAAMFSNVDDLFARGDQWHVGSSRVDRLVEWQPFFRLFPAVETLRLSGKIALSISSAVDDMFDDVFPALRSIRFIKDKDDLESKNEDAWNKLVVSIDRFLSLRQRSGCPVSVIRDIAGDEVR